jgi:hypothetical protein
MNMYLFAARWVDDYQQDGWDGVADPLSGYVILSYAGEDFAAIESHEVPRHEQRETIANTLARFWAKHLPDVLGDAQNMEKAPWI